MKYILFTNQKKAIELGLKNRSQLDILDVISTCHLWAQIEEINGVYFHWVARQKIIEELPILDLKPDTVYKYLTILKEKGFILYEKLGKKDCVKLTQKGASLFTSTMSEKNPSSYVRKKSESNSELNPTYYNTTNYNTTKDNTKTIADLKKSTKERIAIEVLKALNNQTKRSFSIAAKGRGSDNVKMLITLLNKGYTKDEILLMIRFKVFEWGWDDDMKLYLRPETLFKSKAGIYIEAAKEAFKNKDITKAILAKKKKKEDIKNGFKQTELTYTTPAYAGLKTY